MAHFTYLPQVARTPCAFLNANKAKAKQLMSSQSNIISISMVFTGVSEYVLRKVKSNLLVFIQKVLLKVKNCLLYLLNALILIDFVCFYLYLFAFQKNIL